MATVTEPITLDKSINTTESPSRNIADVLAEELKGIADNILPPNASQIAYDNTGSGLNATNVQDAIDEVMSSQADVIADTMADLTENKTATVTDGVADFETIDGSLVKSLVVEIEPSGAGYTQADVTVVGKNQYDLNNVGKNSPNITFIIEGDTITISGSVVRGAVNYTPTVNLSGKTLTLSFTIDSITNAGTPIYFGPVIYNNTTQQYRYTAVPNCSTTGTKSLTFTLSADEVIARIDFNINDKATALEEDRIYVISDVQLEVGSTATTYEPYKGKTYTTNFGQTITAGGTLDFLTGELTTGGSTLSLTPQTVKSLVGENHIQASTGDVTECKYSMLINGDDLAILLS